MADAPAASGRDAREREESEEQPLVNLSTESLNEIMPFGAHLELELVSADPDEVVGKMTWDPGSPPQGAPCTAAC